MLKKGFIFILSIIMLSACEKKAQIPFNKVQQTDSLTPEMLKLNQLVVELEEEAIRMYTDTSKLDFKSPTGSYWIAVTHRAGGEKLNNGDVIGIEYEVKEVQTGEVFYRYTDTESRQMTVGKERYERALQDALQTLHEGDCATVISPSHQAFGALGDRKKIPSRAVLVYQIYSIKKK